MIRLITCFFGLAMSFAASAQFVPAANVQPGHIFNPVPVGNSFVLQPALTNVGNFQRLSYAAGVPGFPVQVGTKVLIAAPGSRDLVVDVVARVSQPKVRLALGNFFKKALPFVSTGVAIYDLAQELNLEVDASPVDGSARFKELRDVVNCDKSGGGASGLTGSGNTTPLATFISQICPDSRYSCQDRSTYTEASCSIKYQPMFTGSDGNVYPQTEALWAVVPATKTQEVILYDHNEVLDKIAARTPTTESALSRLFADSLASGEEAVTEAPHAITGPSSVPNSTTTSNDVTNNTTTTTTTNDVYNYAGDTINKSTNTTNLTINNTTGAVTTNNSSTTTKNEVVQKPASEPVPAEDPCVKNPTRIGCSLFGTPPVAEVVPDTDHAVTVSPVTFASLSACPVPINFTVFAKTYSVSYQPLCDQLARLRVLFLAMAAMVAAFIFTNSFKV